MVDGTKFVGANGDRIANDMYPTPEPRTVLKALFTLWRPETPIVWEPACGNGAISAALDAEGYAVVSTDKFDYGYGLPGVDFFDVRFPESDTIITNPPWGVAREWVEHARKINVRRMALLLPTTFYTTHKGLLNFFHWIPRFVLPLAWRLDFRNLGRPVQTCQWVVWDRDCSGDTRYQPIYRPTPITRPVKRK